MVSKWEDNYDLNNKPFHKYNFDLLPSSPNIYILHYSSIHYSKISTKLSILDGTTMDY